MLTYILFIIIMPVLLMLDYSVYKKKMRKNMEQQPDYESNRENYEILLERLYQQQKKVTIISGVVICVVALVLGMLFLYLMGSVNP